MGELERALAKEMARIMREARRRTPCVPPQCFCPECCPPDPTFKTTGFLRKAIDDARLSAAMLKRLRVTKRNG